MSAWRIILVACLCAGFAASSRGEANAQSPTPTGATAPISTPTPAPPEPADFAVIPWVNARNSARQVIAKIGETVCATGVPTTGSGLGIFGVSVPSAEALPGCGRDGAVVTFFVDGQQAPQTAIWHSRAFPGASQLVQLIIGPPFARFFGGVSPSKLSPGQEVVPYVADTVCGYGEANDPRDAYEAVVYSSEQQAGCGTEGAQVTFKLLDAQGNVIAVANEKATWHAWDAVFEHIQRLDLTFGPAAVITMPGTGMGDALRSATSAFATLVVALSGIGLVGVATGAALDLMLRRQATTR